MIINVKLILSRDKQVCDMVNMEHLHKTRILPFSNIRHPSLKMNKFILQTNSRIHLTTNNNLSLPASNYAETKSVFSKCFHGKMLINCYSHRQYGLLCRVDDCK